jgi:hypothetical protein
MATAIKIDQLSIEGLISKLAEIIGDDLAQSLVCVAQTPDEVNLDAQLLINDGLDKLNLDQKRQTLSLLNAYAKS